MVMEPYQVHRCTRECAATGRQLVPGEEVYSALIPDGGGWKRLDYSASSWQGPPDGAIGWWKSQVPDPSAKRPGLAPNEVLLDLLQQWAEQPEAAQLRYVLALLLVRRRVLRWEDEQSDPSGRQVLVLYCPRRETTYEVPVVPPAEGELEQIQQELSRLVFGEET